MSRIVDAQVSRYRRIFGGATCVGVGIYVLDRRSALLDIGGQNFEIGTVRFLGKYNEIDDRRRAEMQAAQEIQPSLVAVLVPDHGEFRTSDGSIVRGHRILGWDDGRARVADLNWDHLPTLGYGVRNVRRGVYSLHTLLEGLLAPVALSRAIVEGVVDFKGRIVRRGQPRIIRCDRVELYFRALRGLTYGFPMVAARG